MDEAEPVTIVNRVAVAGQVAPPLADDWVTRLRDDEDRDEAIRELQKLMLRAARHQIARMPESGELGWARREEIVHAAADEAWSGVDTGGCVGVRPGARRGCRATGASDSSRRCRSGLVGP